MPIAIWDEFKLQFQEESCILPGVPHTAFRLLRADGSCAWMKRSLRICLLLFVVASASALELQQVRWGFDGRAVPGRFNLLSVLVANPSATPFDRAMYLYKSRGLEQRVGATYETPCYLSPRMSRWVQFYVYIDNQYDQWRLEWGGTPDDHHEVEAPKWGPPAQVLLTDSEITVSSVSALRQFPEELFPPTGAATSGLDSVLLDHAPRWESAKRQAFLNWLRAGGKVHLLMGADGRYPSFADELNMLNSSRERTRIGSGLVVRHAATAREIRAPDVEDGVVPLRQSKPDEPTALPQTTDSFFRALARLSHPRHSWGWIYMLAIAYLALVGPGNLMAGRRLADYRLRIGLLLATVVGFAWLFNIVGRRGQGEASVVHTLSYARSVDGDTYNVMQWVNVFATRGAHYTIKHPAPHNIYATGQDYEPVNGWIESGKDGQFKVDIPMFSRRAFLHEAEMKGANLGVKIESWDGAETLKKLSLTMRPDFTNQILEGWVVQGDQAYAMKLTGGRLEFGDPGKQSLSSLLSESGSQHGVPDYANPYDDDTAVTDVKGRFRELVKPLIAWSLNTENFTRADASAPAADGRVQLFLFARSPESFCISGSQFGREIGYVLYHLDLFRPGS
jgi:hypothetical protein